MNRQIRLKYLAGFLIASGTAFFLWWIVRFFLYLLDYYGPNPLPFGEGHPPVEALSWLAWSLAILADSGTTIAGINLYAAGMLTFLCVFESNLFSRKSSRSLIYLGCSFIGLGLYDPHIDIMWHYAVAVDDFGAELHGGENYWRPLHLTVMFAGALIALLGYVMNEARLIDEENKAFV